jgi:hypothetical protein
VVRGEDRRFHVYRGANQALTSQFASGVVEEEAPDALYLAVGSIASALVSPGILRALNPVVVMSAITVVIVYAVLRSAYPMP